MLKRSNYTLILILPLDVNAEDLRVTIGQHEVNTEDYISIAIKEDHPDYQK